MKLELKHLAGYLPYGLRVRYQIIGRYSSTRNEILEGRHIDSLSIYKTFKPIIRPLSDLTKEIEVNGEKFIPTDIINKDFFWDYVRNNMRLLVEDKSYILVGYLPALVVQKLLEWHFDIYGLIENGLAIDINTLKND